jgi:hypothetical protein
MAAMGRQTKHGIDGPGNENQLPGDKPNNKRNQNTNQRKI